jgi:hypothetical protein
MKNKEDKGLNQSIDKLWSKIFQLAGEDLWHNRWNYSELISLVLWP